jgi:hypothetical protein
MKKMDWRHQDPDDPHTNCHHCGPPASETMLGLRCHLCHCHDIATAHPVPLPENHEMLRDLARIGVPCAAEKLTSKPNAALTGG